MKSTPITNKIFFLQKLIAAGLLYNLILIPSSLFLTFGILSAQNMTSWQIDLSQPVLSLAFKVLFVFFK